MTAVVVAHCFPGQGKLNVQIMLKSPAFTICTCFPGQDKLSSSSSSSSSSNSNSSSNWILMSCQPYRVTSEQSNSGHKQIHISKLFSQCINPLLSQSTKPITLQTWNIYTNIKHIFEQLFTSILPLLQKSHKARTCWYHRPFHLIYWYWVKEKSKKGMDRHNVK